MAVTSLTSNSNLTAQAIANEQHGSPTGSGSAVSSGNGNGGAVGNAAAATATGTGTGNLAGQIAVTVNATADGEPSGAANSSAWFAGNRRDRPAAPAAAAAAWAMNLVIRRVDQKRHLESLRLIRQGVVAAASRRRGSRAARCRWLGTRQQQGTQDFMPLGFSGNVTVQNATLVSQGHDRFAASEC